ncbi:alpha/beta fold hydrolase [Hazenella sp. IB182353]|uniref:alpha/beta fold hydrolase n=1 Tax=Polycladospora coralii TaxID=2771432 RepID=UPI00174785EA|nr:alpha/beta hydrolase [Polycladospora coralii]MBS7531339.1 alpha/beta fold hydrolase [Polycladospora coralii]
MEKEVVVWITGWSLPDRFWHDYAKSLPEYDHVFLSGEGCQNEMDIYQRAESLIHIINKRRIYIVGWSLGAMLGLHLATRFSNHIQKLFLINASGCFVKSEQNPEGWDKRILRRMIRKLNQNPEFVLRAFDQQMFTTNEMSQGLLRSFQDQYRTGEWDCDALTAGLRFLLHFSIYPDLGQVTSQVWMWMSEQDQICSPQEGRRLASLVSQCKLYSDDKQGHAVPWTAPARIRDWLVKGMQDHD